VKATRSKLLLVWMCLLVAGGLSHAATIGPDAFGYRATDDVPFSYVSIAGTGTRVLAGADDLVHLAGLGFNFTFYGTSYNTVCFSPNGLVTFGGCSGTFTNRNLTGDFIPSSAHSSVEVGGIAVLWDDWQFFQSGADAVYFIQVSGTPGNRALTIQWNIAFGFASSPQSVTFQVILFENNGDILMLYPDTDSGDFRSSGASATVGIRAAGAGSTNNRLQWSFDQAVIPSGKAIRFLSPASPHGFRHLVAGLFGHHPTHRHHGRHGHGQPDYPPFFHEEELVEADTSGGESPAAVMLAALNQDGTINANSRMASRLNGQSARPARRGTIVQMFGPAEDLILLERSGLSRTRSLPTVSIGGGAAEVMFSGLAPGLDAVWQINVRIPDEAPSGADVPVDITYEGRPLARQVLIAIE